VMLWETHPEIRLSACGISLLGTERPMRTVNSAWSALSMIYNL
jgi:hypothetical protein